MCTTVSYVYSCRHSENTIFRCGNLPQDASPEVIEACTRRETLISGNWVTQLHEFCPRCEQHYRQARRRARHQLTPPPRRRARATEAASISVAPALNRRIAPSAKNDEQAEAEAHNRIVDSMVEQLIEEVDDQRANTADVHDFRANDRPWMAVLPQRRAEGVIRPLQTSHLANIGRAEGRIRGLTPTQVWRFLP